MSNREKLLEMKDLVIILEVARLGLAMCFDEIAEELDLSDEELKRIQVYIQNQLNPKRTT